MFEELGLIGNAVLLIATLAMLAKASETTITNALNVASVTRLGKTTVGFILVAFSTSLPEFFVAIFSTINPENVGVSIGNVLGANISNICLILGSCFLLLALKSPRGSFFLRWLKEELSSLHFGLFIASIVPLSLLYLQHVSRFIGIILFGIFIFYMYKLSKSGAPEAEAPSRAEKHKLRRYITITFLGALGVVVCAFFIVESASNIAASIGLPAIIIGATIVSFGTTMPEFATSISAVRKGHLELALGNIIGSCFVNITLILGVTLAGTSVGINTNAFSNVVLFSLMANLLLWYFLSGDKMGWREAAILLFMYALFLTIGFGAL